MCYWSVKMSVMKGLTLNSKEQQRVQVLNKVLEKRWSVLKAAELLNLSERQVWRFLAAYMVVYVPLE